MASTNWSEAVKAAREATQDLIWALRGRHIEVADVTHGVANPPIAYQVCQAGDYVDITGWEVAYRRVTDREVYGWQLTPEEAIEVAKALADAENHIVVGIDVEMLVLEATVLVENRKRLVKEGVAA